MTKPEFFTLYRQDRGVKSISIESTLCLYYSKRCSAKNKSNFVINIKLLLLYRGLQTYHMFILGHFWRLYKFSFMTRKFVKGILEPPIVSSFKTIQCYSHFKYLRGFKTAKTCCVTLGQRYQLYISLCAVWRLECEHGSVQCVLCSVQCALCSVKCAMCSVQCVLNWRQFPVTFTPIYCAELTACSFECVQYTEFSV